MTWSNCWRTKPGVLATLGVFFHVVFLGGYQLGASFHAFEGTCGSDETEMEKVSTKK